MYLDYQFYYFHFALGTISYTISRIIFFTIATLAIKDLVQTFQGNKNLLGFHVLPEFVLQSKEALITISAIAIIMSAFPVINTMIDIINLVKIKTNLFKKDDDHFYYNEYVEKIKNFLDRNKEPTPHLDGTIICWLEGVIGLSNH